MLLWLKISWLAQIKSRGSAYLVLSSSSPLFRCLAPKPSAVFPSVHPDVPPQSSRGLQQKTRQFCSSYIQHEQNIHSYVRLWRTTCWKLMQNIHNQSFLLLPWNLEHPIHTSKKKKKNNNLLKTPIKTNMTFIAGACLMTQNIHDPGHYSKQGCCFLIP